MIMGGGGKYLLISSLFKRNKDSINITESINKNIDVKDSIESKQSYINKQDSINPSDINKDIESNHKNSAKIDSKQSESAQNHTKNQDFNNKDSNQNYNIESKTQDSNKTLSNIFFYAYIIFLALLCLSFGAIMFPFGDDFLYTSNASVFYSPTNFAHAFTPILWQRGRHIADILMALSLRPFGEILISFGLSVTIAYKIVASFFVCVFYFLAFISYSLLVYFLNGKKDFRIIFIFTSLIIICIFHRADYINFAAYLGSAGLSMLVFLPILHYFLFNVEYRYSADSTINIPLTLLFVYFASFQIEPSSLIVFGLCVFIALYYIATRFYKNINMWFYIISFIVLVPLSVAMTTFSGRGRTQREMIADFSYLDSMITYIRAFIKNYYFLHINQLLVAAIIICFGIFIYILIKRKIAKILYIQFALLTIGIVGMLGFAAIRVPGIYFPCIIILLTLFSFVLAFRYSRIFIIRLIINTFLISGVAALICDSISVYESEFKRLSPYKDSINNLILLYKNAEEKGLDKLIITPQDIQKYHLQMQNITTDSKSFSNSTISSWMQYYGFTTKYIKIFLEDSNDEDSKDSKDNVNE
ncbi:hypothetical protein DCO59_05580 [Helicobacter saguini]|uniref:hypothetical protein n=1 Tax=Helicobacter saguini TaxID=1548018 RepID=UPI001370C1B8|nr:hypothetical protein [Helicobacter saguini]MWV71833.1 hypothetical protein [Helicobacter saguini]